MTTLECILKDLKDHTVDEGKIKSPEYRLMMQFDPDKFEDTVEEQYSFTCIEDKTNNFRHYESVNCDCSMYFTRICITVFNDGDMLNSMALGFTKHDKTWKPLIACSVPWKEYNVLLEVQMHLANRCYDWLEAVFNSDKGHKKRKRHRKKKKDVTGNQR